jgi:hypothetical protein
MKNKELIEEEIQNFISSDLNNEIMNLYEIENILLKFIIIS